MSWPGNEKWLYLFNILVSRWVNSGKNISTYTPDSILCIKLDEIGDMAACTHVFSLLKKRFPQATIDVITNAYSAPLIQNHPDISHVFTSLDAWKHKYDLLVELRGNRKSLWRTFRYYPKIRLDRGLVRMRHRGNQLHEVYTNYEIIEPVLAGLPFEPPALYPTEANQKHVTDFLNANQIRNYFVVHCGARRELRRWTDKGFAEIASWISEKWGLVPVFAGVESEEEQINRVTEGMAGRHVLFTRGFDLGDLTALLQRSVFFLGNESGPLQMADNLNVPLVALFGPGVKNVFYPRGPRAHLIHHVLDCNPCDQIHCVRPGNTCMQMIEVAEVKAAVSAALSHLPQNPAP